MIKDIVKDPEVLQQLSVAVNNKADQQVVQDLLDTAMAHIDICLGLAAVQIGVHKRIIVIRSGKGFIPMINPTITWHSKETEEAEEGCLSLEGTRTTNRPIKIEVMYQKRIGGKYERVRVSNVDDIPFARLIQHEIDHTKGVLI